MTSTRLLVLCGVGAAGLLALTWGGTAPAPRKKGDLGVPIDAEVAFLESRVATLPTSGLDRAALAAAYLARARATQDPRWFSRAEEEARRSLELLPVHNAGACEVLAEVAGARHDFAGSERLARAALGVNAASAGATTTLMTALLALGHADALDEAEREAGALAKRLPTTGALTLWALVRERHGDDARAHPLLERAVEVDDDLNPELSAYTRGLLARLHLRQGRLELARTTCLDALRLRRDHALCTQLLAEAVARQGRVEVAAQIARQATGHGVWVHVAGVLARQGRADLAGGLWERAEVALRASVARGEGHEGLLAALLLDRGRAEDARAALALADTDSSRRGDPRARWTLGRALARAGQLERARAAFAQALAPGWREPQLYLDAARVEDALGDAAKAEALRAAAKAIDPACLSSPAR